MTATDYLKSLAAEIVGVSIDKNRLAEDHEPNIIKDDPIAPDTAQASTGYPARDDLDPTDAPLIAPARRPDQG
jgi:hypothetical protein